MPHGTTCLDQHSDTTRRILPDASVVHCLIGKLWQAQNDNKKSIESYVAAVKVNPFLWEAFTGLCNTGKTAPMLACYAAIFLPRPCLVDSRARCEPSGKQHIQAKLGDGGILQNRARPIKFDAYGRTGTPN